MNKIQSAPIPSTLHRYSIFIVVYSTPALSLHLALHLSLTLVYPSSLLCSLFLHSIHVPFFPVQFFLCLCSDYHTFPTHPSPLPPPHPQREVHSPPGSRYSSGTGCWSRRGVGWATSGMAGSASCPGWRVGCGHGAWGQAPAGWSPGQSPPLWRSHPGLRGLGPRLLPGLHLTAAGTHWPPGGAGLPSGLSLEGGEEESRKHVEKEAHTLKCVSYSDTRRKN